MAHGIDIDRVLQYKDTGGRPVPDLSDVIKRFHEWLIVNYVQPVHLFPDRARELGIVSTRPNGVIKMDVETAVLAGTEAEYELIVPTGKNWYASNWWLQNNTNAGTREIRIAGKEVTELVLVEVNGASAGSPTTSGADVAMTAGWKAIFRVTGLLNDAVRYGLTYVEEDIT